MENIWGEKREQMKGESKGGLFFLFFFWEFVPVFWWKEGARKEGRKEGRKEERKKEVTFS